MYINKLLVTQQCSECTSAAFAAGFALFKNALIRALIVAVHGASNPGTTSVSKI
jgi:hypothetical protein